jgi:hypothetical protein
MKELKKKETGNRWLMAQGKQCWKRQGEKRKKS